MRFPRAQRRPGPSSLTPALLHRISLNFRWKQRTISLFARTALAWRPLGSGPPRANPAKAWKTAWAQPMTPGPPSGACAAGAARARAAREDQRACARERLSRANSPGRGANGPAHGGGGARVRRENPREAQLHFRRRPTAVLLLLLIPPLPSWRSAASPTSLRAAVPGSAPRCRAPSRRGAPRAPPSPRLAPRLRVLAAAASAPARLPSPRATSVCRPRARG